MSTEAERELFEKWFDADATSYGCEHSNWFKRDEDGDYEIQHVSWAWNGWQAARASRDEGAQPVAVLERGEGGFFRVNADSLMAIYAMPPGKHPLYTHPQPPDRKVMERARDALNTARNGLRWYRDTFPESANECDDEADEEIDAAIRDLDAALGGAGEGGQG